MSTSGVLFALEVFGRLLPKETSEETKGQRQLSLRHALYCTLSSVFATHTIRVLRAKFSPGIAITSHPFAAADYILSDNLMKELPIFGLLGGLCSLFAIIFAKSRTMFSSIYRSFPIIPYQARPLLGIAIASRFQGEYGLSSGVELLKRLLENAGSMNTISGLAASSVAGRMLLTPLVLASGVLGGLVAPSLFIGASLGGLLHCFSIGEAANHSLVFLSSGSVYILAGAAATLAVFFRSPLTALILVWELSRAHPTVVPIVAFTIFSACRSIDFFTQQLKTEEHIGLKWDGKNTLEKLHKAVLSEPIIVPANVVSFP